MINIIFKNAFKFSKHDTNTFILLLSKEIYSYKYMDDWEKINKEALREKKELFNNLNLEPISEEGYNHGNRIYRDFKIENLGEYRKFSTHRRV